MIQDAMACLVMVRGISFWYGCTRKAGTAAQVLYVVEEGTLECYKNIDGNEKMVKVPLSFVLLNSYLSSHERDESPFVFLSRKYPEEHESPDLRKLDPISDDAELLNFDLDKLLRCTQSVLIDVNNDVTYTD